jgi:DNA-binding beta-propeller fold protein YncE
MRKSIWASPLLVLVVFGFLRLQAGAQAGAKPMLIVVNQVDKTVSFVDPVTEKQVAVVPQQETTVHAHEVEVTPDGKTAFLPVYGSVGVGKPGIDGQRMIVMDVPSRKITGYVDFGHPVRPHDPVYDPASGMLYVTTELDQAVTIVDPKTLKIVGKIPTSQEQSHMLAISHDGALGYTANVGPGTVSVLDMKGRKTVAVIPISGTTQRISISKDDRMVFTSDQTKPQLAVIDTSTNEVKAWVPLPGTGYGTAPTKDGRLLLVVVPEKNVVAVVDLATLKVVKTISVPTNPQEVIVRPDGKVAYVSLAGSSQVAAIDVAGLKVQGLIAVGSYADGLAWAR